MKMSQRVLSGVLISGIIIVLLLLSLSFFASSQPLGLTADWGGHVFTATRVDSWLGRTFLQLKHYDSRGKTVWASRILIPSGYKGEPESFNSCMVWDLAGNIHLMVPGTEEGTTVAYRYARSGRLVWAHPLDNFSGKAILETDGTIRALGTTGAEGQALSLMTVSKDGNITGSRNISAELGDVSFIGLDGNDGFIVGFPELGKLIWLNPNGDVIRTALVEPFYGKASGNGRLDTGVVKDKNAVVKFDPSGNTIWSIPLEECFSFNHVVMDDGGNLLINRTTDSQQLKVSLTRVTEHGQIHWSREFPCHPMATATDLFGNVFVLGRIGNKAMLMKHDAEGHLVWKRQNGLSPLAALFPGQPVQMPD